MTNEQRKSLLDDGKKWQGVSRGMGVVVGVAGAVAIIGAWRGYFSKPSEKKQVSGTVGLRKRRQLEVTPVVTHTGAGATLRYDW